MDEILDADAQRLVELRERVNDMRVNGDLIIDLLPEPPLDFPGCDDVNGRFDWYEVVDAGKRIGVFHVPKGVEL